MFGFVRARSDRPQFCPRCGHIPGRLWTSRSGRARLWRWYRCDVECWLHPTRWWKGWHD